MILYFKKIMRRNCERIDKVSDHELNIELDFQNYFLGLPNEILVEIIKLLSLKDRKNLGSVNIRLI